jgi:[protein-PII] uridylyltransferase
MNSPKADPLVYEQPGSRAPEARFAGGESGIAFIKQRVADIRERARSMFQAGSPGIQITTTTCQAVEGLLLEFIESALAGHPGDRENLLNHTAVVAVGGFGRGELSPYSDVDLLFLHEGTGNRFADVAAQVVQNCWDAKLSLGHSIRTIGDCLSLSRDDAQIATNLIEARHVWGSAPLVETLRKQFRRHLVNWRLRTFMDRCIQARNGCWSEHGPPAQEIEPNIKDSLGCLRDLHLLRWLGYARFDAVDLDSQRLRGAFSMDEVRVLRGAWEKLTRIRVDLHLEAGRPQDVLTHDEQLRIAQSSGYEEDHPQRPVEQFMQDLFRETTAVATIARRFVTRHRPRRIAAQVKDFLIGHRADNLIIYSDRIDARRGALDDVTSSIESILRVYRSASLYGMLPSPVLADAIRSAIVELPHEITPAAGQIFMEILKGSRSLGSVLRSMYDTGLLDVLIPDYAHSRCLLQFNQYHKFTVDEHTLRAVEACCRFEDDQGPLGSAYRTLKHRELVHLALILHDLGKGFGRPHSEVGKEIATRVGHRLHLGEHHTEIIETLVYRHLDMAHLAFRRDFSDPVLLVKFAHLVGTSEMLRMLYVLTAADVMAVGPDVWTDWKGDLLADLFDQTMVTVSGKRYAYHQTERFEAVKAKVAAHFGSSNDGATPRREWVRQRLAGFSAYYLTCTPPERIADDLKVIETLSDDQIVISGIPAAANNTVEYRVVTRERPDTVGCFQKMAGVLAALRCEILGADINTTRDGVIVDRFHVIDRDYEGETPPEFRIADVCQSLRQVLSGRQSVEGIFQRFRTPGAAAGEQISDLPLRVVVDNESSDSRTVIDVFAHDRPGLLYTIARTIFDLRLSVDLAKIATHYDQVVDVFYVVDEAGNKITNADRLKHIEATLLDKLREFEQHGHAMFRKP